MPQRYFCLMALTVVAAACDVLEVQEAEYEHYQQMIEDGAIERGWVPSFVPASASGIHERHDLDTNQVWVRFHFDPTHLESMVGGCRKTSPEGGHAARRPVCKHKLVAGRLGRAFSAVATRILPV